MAVQDLGHALGIEPELLAAEQLAALADCAVRRSKSRSPGQVSQYNATALKVAPMRARARRVMRVGLLIMLAGFVVFVIGAVRFGSTLVRCG